jgi:N-methylhydantoinase A
MRYSIGIDIGGTCTDCVVIDQDGHATLGKAFSTPPDFSAGIVESLGDAARQLDTTLAELLAGTELFLHSTTVAENAIVDGDLVATGVLTTAGYSDTLFTTRGGFGRWSGLTDDEKRNPTDTEKPEPLVPLSRIETLDERVDRSGTVLRPVDPAEVEQAIDRLVANGAQAVGVCLLWSFNNPQNELAARDVILRRHPGLFVTLSHEVAPVLGEYERTSTVALNAGLGPVVGAYLDNLTSQLADLGFSGTLLVMQAYGGLLPAEVAGTRPVGMIESGPVSGLMGCKRLGELIGRPNLINADIGGTTFKVGVVREGLIDYQRESLALRYHYALPKVDIVSLGIAGGSIVSVDERTGVPRIGPRSAGSYPGPVVYQHGGSEPTVTDTDAVLGFLNPAFFLGGRAALDIDLARANYLEKVASPLGLETEAAAIEIYRLTNSLLYDLLHRTTIQRGLDPRSFALFSTGGTAGMHLPVVAAQLGLAATVVPYTASVHGAFGLVTSDVVHTEVVSRPMRHPADPMAVQKVFDELTDRTVSQLRAEGFTDDEITVERAIDMRYGRQVHEVTTPVPGDGPCSPELLEAAVDAFEHLYTERYGPESTYRDAGVEMVTYRVRASGSVDKPDLAQFSGSATTDSAGSVDHAVVERRPAFVPAEQVIREIPGYDLTLLGPGDRVVGPALIWSPVTTILVDAGTVADIDAYRNLVLVQA